jgi:hypothetical protein
MEIMNGKWSIVILLAVALSTVASVCEDDNDEITGTYQLLIFESEDECDNEINQYSSQATISRSGDGFIIEFGDEGTLTGGFNDEGALEASGNTVVIVDGNPVAAFMQIQLIIQQGNISAGNGNLRYDGTFPGVPGTCTQTFSIDGSRADNLAPILG